MFVGREPAEAITSWFSMETIRRVHFTFAFVLIFAFVFRIYGAIRYLGDRLLPKFRSRLYWVGIKQTFLHYLMLPRQEEHRVLRNSLARTSYLIVYILMFLEICTGLAMFSQIRPDSFVAKIFNPINLLFSEYDTHIIHHYIAWCFLLFTVMHVYLAFREDVMEESGEVSSMVSGMEFYPHDPEDIEDLYGKRK